MGNLSHSNAKTSIRIRRDKIPALSRSNLYPCLLRFGLNRLPSEEKEEGATEKISTLKDYQIGYVHYDITEVRLKKKKFYLFVGIERRSKYAYIELHERMTQDIAGGFLSKLIQGCSFQNP